MDYSKSKLDKIASKIRHKKDLTKAESLIFEDFRKNHSKILNSFQTLIRRKLDRPKWKTVIFAQRLKKRNTIFDKISHRHNGMDLLRMNDIAGCRLIFNNIQELNTFRQVILDTNNRSYKRCNELDKYDYIQKPRDTGYRGIHDIYEEITENNIKLKIEIQYRTKVQHYWATACEIWDSNFNKRSKFGEGNKGEKLFFKLISDFLNYSFDEEDYCPKKNLRIFKRIVKLKKSITYLTRLRTIEKIKIDKKIKKNILFNNFLLDKWSLDLKIEQIKQQKFNDKSINTYNDLEKSSEYSDIVLVMTEGKDLNRAYNNYFNDINSFLKKINTALLKIKNEYPVRFFIYSLIFCNLLERDDLKNLKRGKF
ncbi:MAG: RelA/SpoT domain-containing protein [Alphaproteobacteria bacterium]|jgi:ppGpp synthetase/RelA/SpoT-type nucleotidyltranferase|nr:RelA/SpoT domain-containing protein [Alphaproteobacteria bacterium]